MKISTVLLCLLWAGPLIKAQGLRPSTVRQVFSLQRGDSLEYHMWNVVSCGPNCNYYFLKIVDSTYYNVAQDTLSILFSTQLLRYDSAGVGGSCSGQCSEYFTWSDICPIAQNKWVLTSPDSNIVSFLDSTYHIVPPIGAVSDSIYRDSLEYNSSKQNFYSGRVSFDGSTDVYVDSIGIVYKGENVELSSNNRERLIYYHKANGRTWGTPFINTGIGDISEEYPVSVYPNPAQGRFMVKTDLYQGEQFELYDVLSKEVLSRELITRETEVNSNGLAPGIYYWKLKSENQVIKGGKLVID